MESKSLDAAACFIAWCLVVALDWLCDLLGHSYGLNEWRSHDLDGRRFSWRGCSNCSHSQFHPDSDLY